MTRSPIRLLLTLPLLLLASPGLRAGQPVEGAVTPFRKVEVSAPVSSFLVEIKAQEGQAVKAGQPLAQLYGRLEELELQRAKALLTRREYEAKGANNLFDGRIISEAKAMESRFELDLARINYETAVEHVKLRTLLAPIDGILVKRYHELGEAVSTSQAVFQVLDLSKVIVHCAVRPERVGRLTQGRKASVRIPQMDGAPLFQGEVVLIEPRAEASGLFPVKVVVENPELRIRAGLRALVEFPD
jgi:membrane fusion protein (multidrug efflux system)